MIPVKIIPHGDRSIAAGYNKFALQQVGILQTQMGFQGLKQGKRTVSPIDGVTVSCNIAFSSRVVDIYIDPIKSYVAAAEDEDEVIAPVIDEIEVIEEFGEIEYFVRIKSDDPGGNPPFVTLVTEPCGIKMDRIIIWRMYFSPLVAEARDPGNKVNRAKDFVPGKGKVIFDVDVLSGVIYKSTSNDDVETRLKAARYADILPTNSFPVNNVVHNSARDWLASGGIENPRTAAREAGYGNEMLSELARDFQISDSYECDDVVWWLFTDEVIKHANYWFDYFDDDGWRKRWSPLYEDAEGVLTPGDSEYYKNQYNFHGLDNVSQYYPNLRIGGADLCNCVSHGASGPSEDYTFYLEDVNVIPRVWIWIDHEVLFYTTSTCGELTEDGAFYPVGGNFFTTSQELTETPEGINSFFIIEATKIPLEDGNIFETGTASIVTGEAAEYYGVEPPTVGQQWGGNGIGWPNNYLEYPGVGYGPRFYVAAQVTSSYGDTLITPLESLDYTDFMAFTGGSNATCSEIMGTYWNNFPEIQAVVYEAKHQIIESWDSPEEITKINMYNDALDGAIANLGIPNYKTSYTNTYGNTYDYQYYVKNSGDAGFDLYQVCNVHAVNEKENESDLTEQTKFFSLFYFNEVKVKTKAGVGDIPSYGIQYCTCNGFFTAWVSDDYPTTDTSSVGCVIYIFAPEKFVETNDEGISTYWDIHSARRGSGIINPYRCLDLEEYLLPIFTGIQTQLNNDPLATKHESDPDIACTMNRHGIGITNGFTRSTSVTVTTEEEED